MQEKSLFISTKIQEDLCGVELKNKKSLDVQMESFEVTKDPCGREVDGIQTPIYDSMAKEDENPSTRNIEKLITLESNLLSQMTYVVEQKNTSINDHKYRDFEATHPVVFQSVTEMNDGPSHKVAVRNNIQEKKEELQSVEESTESYQKSTKVVQKHTYQPLHLFDDKSEARIHLKHESGKRGIVVSRRVKIHRKSFAAYKTSTDDFKLCQLSATVNIERLSTNTLRVWERVSRRTRDSQCEISSTSQPHEAMYKTMFENRTPGITSNDKAFFCKPSMLHESKAVKSQNIKPKIECIQTPIPMPENTISPCLSPSSKSSSEFSDSINITPYQDIERALQVVELDKSGCSSSNEPDSSENVDSVQCHSNAIFDSARVNKIIQWFSYQTKLQRKFLDSYREILNGNVPVLDTESILNGTGSLEEPHSKFDIRLSEQEVCQELESKSLVDAFDFNSTSTKNSIVSNDFLEIQQTDCPSLSNLLDENRSPATQIPSTHETHTQSISGNINNESDSNAAFLNSPNIFMAAPVDSSNFYHKKSMNLIKELSTINSQLSSQIRDENWRMFNTSGGKLGSSMISHEAQELARRFDNVYQKYIDLQNLVEASKITSDMTPLPVPVPDTFDFETRTLKNKIYNCKVDSNENEIVNETQLPLKKRKLSMGIATPARFVPVPESISYPATPMLSIADIYNPPIPRSFKTPAEKKQLIPDSSAISINYVPPKPDSFSCSMNTFSSAIYRLNECPSNVEIDDCSSYCLPSMMFPPESYSHSPGL